MNLYGAIKGAIGATSYGGAIGDSDGNYEILQRTSGVIGAIHTRMEGILNGLQLTWNVGIRKLYVELDSHVALD